MAILLAATLVLTRAQETIHQISDLNNCDPKAIYDLNLESTVWWGRGGLLVLEDESGAAAVELNRGSEAIESGTRIRMQGKGAVARSGPGFRLGVTGALIENDGVHSETEKVGVIHLEKGRHPIQVEWFNKQAGAALILEVEGPDSPRQPAPNSEVDFLSYEGDWETLPDFSTLTPSSSGNARGFDVSVRSRPENVAVVFRGEFEATATGRHVFYLKSDDGSRLRMRETPFQIARLGSISRPAVNRNAFGEIGRGVWTEVRGEVVLQNGTRLEVRRGGDRFVLELAQAGNWQGRRVRAVGFCLAARGVHGEWTPGVIYVPSSDDVEKLESPTVSNDALATAEAVHALKRAEAEAGRKARINGVITCVLPELQGFVMQDFTRGMYVLDRSPSRIDAPRVGEFVSVEGVTDPGLFAPFVHASVVAGLGPGKLPEAVPPSWDQLMNGSMDAQFVQMRGVVISTRTNGLTLRLREGVLQIEVRPMPASMAKLENAVVRLRGCLLALWDYRTHQVKAGELRLYGADITIEQPPPVDIFACPEKTIPDLLTFDPHAGAFQRVKVRGQILHVDGTNSFLAQAQQGLRFVTNARGTWGAGDLVEVVGFPELAGSASPSLRDAAVRQTGKGALPEARPLAAETFPMGLDATLVRVRGELLDARPAGGGQVLELRAGLRSFVARIQQGQMNTAPGSTLELTGVYSSLRSGPGSFEILLNSPGDVRTLATPPWWTLRKLIATLVALAVVLGAALLWITMLRRQVEQRSAELSAVIQQRERLENQRALERERDRIAQDLHDELGSGITEMSMLVARARLPAAEEKRTGYLVQVGEKARELVTALDEIVWAMNPRHDSVGSLVTYFSLYAERFLGLANIAWRIEQPATISERPIDSAARHQLFLAFKEALTNIVRHSGATEVCLRVEQSGHELFLTIADNGRGLPESPRTEMMDGLQNMRLRLEKLGGRFESQNRAEGGAVLKFHVPVKTS